MGGEVGGGHGVAKPVEKACDLSANSWKDREERARTMLKTVGFMNFKNLEGAADMTLDLTQECGHLLLESLLPSPNRQVPGSGLVAHRPGHELVVPGLELLPCSDP